MPLWGKTTSDESKPKYLDNVNKNGLAEDCFATEQGWVLRHYKGSDKNTARYWDELLVAIGGLAGAGSTTEGLGAATITGAFFEQESLSQGDTGTVVVVFNELVTVANSPTVVLDGTVTGAGAITATYARGSGLNRIEFDFTVPNSTQQLEIPAQTIGTAGSATIKDSGQTVDADLTIASGDVRGAGGSGSDKTLSIA